MCFQVCVDYLASQQHQVDGWIQSMFCLGGIKVFTVGNLFAQGSEVRHCWSGSSVG